MTSPYDDEFYASINQGSTASARVVLPLLLDLLPVQSVVDFGCGQGAWLEVWRELGVTDRIGVDGEYVDPDALLIPPELFRPADLSTPVDLGRRFDVVQTLEVAEHLPRAAADAFVKTLVQHGDIVFHSAAVPGQGGTRHINEQPRSWWRERFAAHDYVPVDPFRRHLLHTQDVKPWYRYNVLLYVRRERLAELPALAPYVVPDGQPIADLSPLPYKLRKVVLARLPVPAIDLLARVKVKVLAGIATMRRSD